MQAFDRKLGHYNVFSEHGRVLRITPLTAPYRLQGASLEPHRRETPTGSSHSYPKSGAPHRQLRIFWTVLSTAGFGNGRELT